MVLRRGYKSAANRILLDIQHTSLELLFSHDLALVEAAHPYIHLAFHLEGKPSFDELHGFFERDVWSRRDESVEMVSHDDEGMQVEFPLTSIVKDGLLKHLRGGSDLKKASALRRNGGDEIGSSLLWCKLHVGSITERPVAKARLH